MSPAPDSCALGATGERGTPTVPTCSPIPSTCLSQGFRRVRHLSLSLGSFLTWKTSDVHNGRLITLYGLSLTHIIPHPRLARHWGPSRKGRASVQRCSAHELTVVYGASLSLTSFTFTVEIAPGVVVRTNAHVQSTQHRTWKVVPKCVWFLTVIYY